MGFVFEKVDLGAAMAIVGWKYPPPYHVYNLNDSTLALARLVDGPYFAARFDGELMGFFCYGTAARLNGKKDSELYSSRAYLDVGLGMHPAWCGRGKGLGFVRSGLLFARSQDWQGGFRLTVASNNTRARTVYARLGFEEIGRIVWDSPLNRDFVVMTLDSCEPTVQVVADH